MTFRNLKTLSLFTISSLGWGYILNHSNYVEDHMKVRPRQGHATQSDSSKNEKFWARKEIFNIILAETKSKESIKLLLPPVQGQITLIPSQDDFYREYFSNLDHGIGREYQERWGLSPLTKFSSEDSLKNEKSDFAMRVVRMRFDAVIRQYFSSSRRPDNVKQTARVIQTIKNQQINLTSGSSDKFNLSYNLSEDFTRIEYSRRNWHMGFYSTSLLKGLNINRFSFELTAQLQAQLLSTTLKYNFNDSRVESIWRKNLGPTLDTEISTSYSTIPNHPSYTHNAKFIFKF